MEKLPQRIGKYELIESLGSGGMAQVYRARDTVLGRTVAIKILRQDTAAEDGVRQRFLAEAKLASNISHPNIVGIYDYGVENGRPYMVMEFLERRTLRDLIRDNAEPLSQKLKVALQLALALEYIHSRDIIHRDVKPENVSVDGAGKVTLMDFGISKAVDMSVTSPGFTIGTPRYMAPEHLRGEPVTHLADIYAFGLVLFELLTGQPPRSGDSYEAMFVQILTQPLDLGCLTSDVPDGVRDLVAQCTHSDTAKRPQSMSLVAQTLRGFVVSDRTAEIPMPPRAMYEQTEIARVPEPAARSSWIAPASIAVAVLLILLWSQALTQSASSESVRWIVRLACIAVGAYAVYRLISGIRRRTEDVHPSASKTRVNGPASTGVFARTSPFSAPDPPASAPPAFTASSERPLAREPAPRPPRPPDVEPEPRPSAPEGNRNEGTVMFRTSPPVLPDAAPPPTQFAGDFTRIFNVAAESNARRAEGRPDVSISISSCLNPAFLHRRRNIDRVPFRIGRDRTLVEFALPFDDAISAEHVAIDYRNDCYYIFDLGSSNGTFVNSRELSRNEPEPLFYGSRIVLGSNTELLFQSNDEEELRDLTGTVFDGRYLLKQKLHSSSKSAVYLASDTRFTRLVVVKVLSPKLAGHEGYRSQFTREAEIASALKFPNICRVIDYGEADVGEGRSLYVCSEYLSGGSLSERLLATPVFPVAKVADWLDTLARALDRVHTSGVFHAGIKPSAIVFNEFDEPYLADFALAATTADGHGRGIIGNEGYLAPEQWEGETPSGMSDQYSLAVIAYLLVTGSMPHIGQDNRQVRAFNFQRGAAPAHEIARRAGQADLPTAVSGVLARALSTIPSERFPDATGFATAFREALAPPSEKRPLSVFVSYRRSTCSAWALLLKRELEREYGYEVFVDTEQRDSAGRFPSKLEQRIARCDVFLCMLAKTTLQSAWVNREIDFAHANSKPMIPIFRQFDVPRDLDRYPKPVQDLMSYDGIKLYPEWVDAAVLKLAKSIEQLVPPPRRTPPTA